MTNSIYNSILEKRRQGRHSFAVLIDPDRTDEIKLRRLAELSTKASADYFFVGGSLLTRDSLQECVNLLKQISNLPVVLFPGSTMQISNEADAILFLSLISGRNADLLIGQQVQSAAIIRQSDLEVIPTGYMIIEGGKRTAVEYISNTQPIPSDKEDIAASTAMAGEMLGLKIIYLDSGSGAQQPVPAKLISTIRKNVSIPIICGGGIRTPEAAMQACEAGADIIVVGNAIESDQSLATDLSIAIHSVERTKV